LGFGFRAELSDSHKEMKKVLGSQPIELGVTGKEPGTIKITVLEGISSSLEGMLFICKK
jgi:hypothetical protein